MVELLNLIQSLTISKKAKILSSMVNDNYAQHDSNSSWCIDLLYITFFYILRFILSHLTSLVSLIYPFSLCASMYICMSSYHFK